MPSLLRRTLVTIYALGRRELLVLLGCLLVLLCTWAFLALASAVTAGRSRALDEQIVLKLRRPGEPSTPRGPSWLLPAARDVTALGSTPIVALITVGVVSFLVLDRRHGLAGFVLVAVLGGVALGMLFKSFYARPRPELVPGLAEAYSSSFPSGHSMMSAIIYLTLGALLAVGLQKRHLQVYVLSVAVVLAGLVGCTRVYLGMHYPTDVLAGWSAGFGWAACCLVLARLLQRRGAVESPR